MSLPGNKLIFWVPTPQTLCDIFSLVIWCWKCHLTTTQYDPVWIKSMRDIDSCLKPAPSDLFLENKCVILLHTHYDLLWTVSLPGNKLIFLVPSLQTLCVIQALLSQDDATVTWPPPSVTHFEQKVSHEMDSCSNPTPSDLSVENNCVIRLPTQYDPLWTISIPVDKRILWVPPPQTLCVINSILS